MLNCVTFHESTVFESLDAEAGYGGEGDPDAFATALEIKKALSALYLSVMDSLRRLNALAQSTAAVWPLACISCFPSSSPLDLRPYFPNIRKQMRFLTLFCILQWIPWQLSAHQHANQLKRVTGQVKQSRAHA
jgi:hypothetical protein